jgi:hypothetical protein
MNTDDRKTFSSQSDGRVYEIYVKGHLNNQWSDWPGGMQVKFLDNEEMILSGTIIDQAALMGILIKLNRLNLPLISVNEVIKENDG